jgi:hypothetical protein
VPFKFDFHEYYAKGSAHHSWNGKTASYFFFLN